MLIDDNEDEKYSSTSSLMVEDEDSAQDEPEQLKNYSQISPPRVLEKISES